jgi:hypothetical protein
MEVGLQGEIYAFDRVDGWTDGICLDRPAKL